MFLSSKHRRFNPEDVTTLHDACRLGNYEIAQALLEQGADINIRNSYNYTPLMVATNRSYTIDRTVSEDHLRIIRLLINNNANPDLSHPYEGTALDIATSLSRAEALKLLFPITKNKDSVYYGIIPDPDEYLWDFSMWLQTVTLLEEFGINFRRLWSSENHLKTFLRRFFLSGEDRLNKNDAYKSLNFIISYLDPQAIANQSREVLSIFLYSSNNLIEDEKTFNTYFFKFINAGLTGINAKWENGISPLHFAVWEENVLATKALIAANANINSQNNEGNTPLHIAAEGRASITKILLNAKADTDVLNNNQQDAIQHSKEACVRHQKYRSFTKPEYLEDFKKTYTDAQNMIHQYNTQNAERIKINRTMRMFSIFSRLSGGGQLFASTPNEIKNIIAEFVASPPNL